MKMMALAAWRNVLKMLASTSEAIFSPLLGRVEKRSGLNSILPVLVSPQTAPAVHQTHCLARCRAKVSHHHAQLDQEDPHTQQSHQVTRTSVVETP